MRITHVIDRLHSTVHYSCAETGKTVAVAMSDLRQMKTTAQLNKVLTDRGLYDKPKYPKHPDCDSKYDRYAVGVNFRCTRTSKMVFVALEKLQGMTEEDLDKELTALGLFRHLVAVEP